MGDSILSILEVRRLRHIPSIYLWSSCVPDNIVGWGRGESVNECTCKVNWILVRGKIKLRKGKENKGAGWRWSAHLDTIARHSLPDKGHFSQDPHAVEEWTLPTSQGRVSRQRGQHIYTRRLCSRSDSVPHRE